MKFFLKILLRVLLIGACVWLFFHWVRTPDEVMMENYGLEMPKPVESISTIKEPAEVVVEESEDVQVMPETIKVKHPVPFLVQAPNAQWDDVRYQDACEEASMLMVDLWMKGYGTPTKAEAERLLEELFVDEQEFFGNSLDTSVEDTAKFMREKYEYPVSVIEGVTLFDLYNYLAEGNIIIVPTDGRKLNNPNFSNGGPERHMLVIIGYDLKKKEFITNDPGTRKGKGYRYGADVLYSAIRDYSTGTKEDIQGAEKNVIIIKKN
jgi:hypothetical protein